MRRHVRSAQTVVALLRTWPGLVYLGQNNLAALRTLVRPSRRQAITPHCTEAREGGMCTSVCVCVCVCVQWAGQVGSLLLQSEEVVRVMLDLFYELLRARVPAWTPDPAAAVPGQSRRMYCGVHGRRTSDRRDGHVRAPPGGRRRPAAHMDPIVRAEAHQRVRENGASA
jgi:hypothetical protein